MNTAPEVRSEEGLDLTANPEEHPAGQVLKDLSMGEGRYIDKTAVPVIRAAFREFIKETIMPAIAVMKSRADEMGDSWLVNALNHLEKVYETANSFMSEVDHISGFLSGVGDLNMLAFGRGQSYVFAEALGKIDDAEFLEAKKNYYAADRVKSDHALRLYADCLRKIC